MFLMQLRPYYNVFDLLTKEKKEIGTEGQVVINDDRRNDSCV